MKSTRESVLEESLYYKPSERDVAQLLLAIHPKSFDIQTYKELLLQKQQFQKNNPILIGGFQKVNLVLDPKVTRADLNDLKESSQIGGMCGICFEQISGKGLTCNICKRTVCRNCLTRNRSMKNGFVLKFCQKCDQSFLQGLLNKQFLKEIALYQRAFQTLLKQQQALQLLLAGERAKLRTDKMSEQNKLQLMNEQRIKELRQQRESHRERIQEMESKISWGESMSKGLRVKYRKIKKLLKQSFGSAHSGSEQGDWEPRAEEDFGVEDQGINKSFITTNFDNRSPQDEEVEGIHDRENCKCQII